MRIGMVTLCSLRGQMDANLEKIEAFAEQAAAAGCDLVLFPEFSVHGPWVTYDADADPAELERQSEPIPGPTTRRLTRIAASRGLAIGAGIAERGLAPKPFNAYVIVNGDGLRHVQRKLQPTTSEMDFYRGGGDDMAPFRLGQVSIGVTICADNESSAIHDRLVGLGARVIVEPHFDCIKDFQDAGTSWDQILDFNRRDTLKRRAQDLGRTAGSVRALPGRQGPARRVPRAPRVAAPGHRSLRRLRPRRQAAHGQRRQRGIPARRRHRADGLGKV